MLAIVQYGLYAPSGGEIDHLHGHSRLYIAVYTALSRKWRSKWHVPCREWRLLPFCGYCWPLPVWSESITLQDWGYLATRQDLHCNSILRNGIIVNRVLLLYSWYQHTVLLASPRRINLANGTHRVGGCKHSDRTGGCKHGDIQMGSSYQISQ